MNKSLFARLLAVLAVVAILAFGFTPAANAAVPATGSVSAAMTPGEGVGSASTVCSNTSSSAASSTALLPVVRWSEATANMHSRLDNTWMGDTANLVQRHQIVGNGMAAGNFMWSLGTGLSSFAINFCLLSSAGGAADEVGATFGNIMLNSPLMAMLVIIMVGTLLWQGHRRGNMPWKTMMVKAVLVGVFAAMVAGSMASTGGGKNGDNSVYKPGVMSPGWVVTSMNNLVSSLASAPAAALAANQSTQLDTGDTSTGMDQSNILSCDNYVKGLRKGYQDSYGSGAGALASGVPTIMSSLWERTGLQTWRTAQFGPTGMDTNTWCRLLEWNAKSRTIGTTMDGDRLASATTVRSVMYRVMGELGLQTVYETPAYTRIDNTTADKSLMAWSACRLASGSDPTQVGSWSITEAFSEGENGDKEGKATPADCHGWYTQDDNSAGAFDWSPNPEEVNKRTANLDLRDYVQTIHGNSNTYGLTSVFAYFLSAFCMLVVFGLIALAIIIAKVAMVVMIITVFFLMLVAMMPSATLDKLSGFLKMLLGMNLFIFGIQFLFALVSIITQMLQNAGDSFLGGSGSLVAIFWAGLSPVIAVFLLHMVFTKILKVPSPFKLSAGLAWGGAAAAAGGAAFAGMSNLLDRRQGNMAGAAKRAGSKGLNQALSAASGGKLGRGAATSRRGAASPADAASAGAKGKAGLAGVAGAAGLGSVVGAGAVAAAAAGKGKSGTGVVESVEGAGSTAAAPAGDRPGMFDAALGTAVPNSKLTSGEMTAAERKVAKSLAGEELTNAKQWEFQRRKDAGIPEEATGMRVISEELRNSLSNTKQAFRDKPVRTSLKAAAGVGLLAATTPVLAAPLVVGGAWLTKRAVVNTKRDLMERKHFDDNIVENYRAAARANAKAPSEASAEAPAQDTANSSTGKTSTKTDRRGASQASPDKPSRPAASQASPGLLPGEALGTRRRVQAGETGRRAAATPPRQSAAHNQNDSAGAGPLAPQRPAGQPQPNKPPTRPGEGRTERPAPATSESKGVR